MPESAPRTALFSKTVDPARQCESLQVLHMDDGHQSMRHLVTVPLKVVQHARRISARVLESVNWVRWWTLFIKEMLPKRPRKRPASGEGGG